jgi:hypothetical protein
LATVETIVVGPQHFEIRQGLALESLLIASSSLRSRHGPPMVGPESFWSAAPSASFTFWLKNHGLEMNISRICIQNERVKDQSETGRPNC